MTVTEKSCIEKSVQLLIDVLDNSIIFNQKLENEIFGYLFSVPVFPIYVKLKEGENGRRE